MERKAPNADGQWPRGSGNQSSLAPQGGPGSWQPGPADVLSASFPITRTHTHACGRRAQHTQTHSASGRLWPCSGSGPPGWPGRPEAQEATVLVGAGAGGLRPGGWATSQSRGRGTHAVETSVTGLPPLLSCMKRGPEQAPREWGRDTPGSLHAAGWGVRPQEGPGRGPARRDGLW